MKIKARTLTKAITLGIAIAAFIIALQNKARIRFIESVQENIIEKVLFPRLDIENQNNLSHEKQ